MKIRLNTNYLAACLLVAPKTEVRIQLVSVLLDFKHATNSLVYVATDGSMMACFRDDIDYLEDAQTGDVKLLIPRSALETALKGWRMPYMVLESLPDGRYVLGDVVFATHPHTYPDYMRVVPAHYATPRVLPDGYGYDADLLALAQKALSKARNSKSVPQHQAICGSMNTMAYFSGVGPDTYELVFVMPTRISKAPMIFPGFFEA
jgi:hypothetical protein